MDRRRQLRQPQEQRRPSRELPFEGGRPRNQIVFHDNDKKMPTGNHPPDFPVANRTAVKDEVIDEITNQAINDLWEDTNS